MYNQKYFRTELNKWTKTFPNKTPEQVKQELESKLSGVEVMNNLLTEENKKLKERNEELEKLLEERKKLQNQTEQPLK
jgi:hypothetical protein